MNRYRACPECGGSGYDFWDGGQCDKCSGTGEIVDDYELTDSQTGENVNENYNRVWVQLDGIVLYGYDDPEDNTTTWYDSSGYLDSVSETPDDYEQTANEEGWLY